MTESESWQEVEGNTPDKNQNHVRHQRISGFPNPWIWGSYEYTRQLERRLEELEEKVRKISHAQVHEYNPAEIFMD